MIVRGSTKGISDLELKKATILNWSQRIGNYFGYAALALALTLMIKLVCTNYKRKQVKKYRSNREKFKSAGVEKLEAHHECKCAGS